MAKIKNTNTSLTVEETKLPVDQIEETGDNNVLINDEESNMNNNQSVLTEEEIEFQSKVFEIAGQIGWKELYTKMTEKSTNGSKMDKCVAIYEKMIVDSKNRRIDIINQFMTEVGISKDCASTYIQTIKTKKKKSQEVQQES